MSSGVENTRATADLKTARIFKLSDYRCDFCGRYCGTLSRLDFQRQRRRL
jgi:hypothetical protein